MDASKVTTLTLLDLSAAFDTIDHTVLLRRLVNWIGVTGKALDWFESYLTGRCQRIRLGECLSFKADLKYRVPQGWVLSPLLFTLYTTSLSSMISGHSIPHHLYADDSQLYVSFASGNSAAALHGLQSCFVSVQSWMLTNKHRSLQKVGSRITKHSLYPDTRVWQRVEKKRFPCLLRSGWQYQTLSWCPLQQYTCRFESAFKTGSGGIPLFFTMF